MSDIVEALFISSLNNERASCTVQDLRTGTDLMRYKGGGTMQKHTLQMFGNNFVIAANSTKPLLHVWQVNGQEQMASVRYVVPGKVNALALTPDGAYLVAGIQENIYLWHCNTGRMLNMMSRHFQDITCIRFTDRAEHFVTAGKDGAVLVWNLTRATAPLNTGNVDDNAPQYSLNDHGLAVTDVHIGLGGIHGFMYTVSMDRCCKVYDLSDGTMLLSVVFPVALHSVLVNRMETNAYVGAADGRIFLFHLENVPRMKEYHLEEERTQAFVGHTAGTAVTCLALSVNAQQLISGGEDKQVCIWHVGSRQLIRSIQCLGAITNLHVRLTSPSLFHPGPKEHKFFADSLKRMITPLTEENDVVELLITDEYPRRRPSLQLNFENYYHADSIDSSAPDMCIAGRASAQHNSNAMKSADDAQPECTDEEMPDADAEDLAAEVKKLRKENARLKLEAKRLLNLSVDNIVTNPQNTKSSKKLNKARKK